MSKEKRMIITAISSLALSVLFALPTLAAPAADPTISNALSNLVGLVMGAVTAIGTLLVLWGIAEWGISMNGGGGVEMANSWKRIAGGIVLVIAPQILDILTAV